MPCRTAVMTMVIGATGVIGINAMTMIVTADMIVMIEAAIVERFCVRHCGSLVARC